MCSDGIAPRPGISLPLVTGWGLWMEKDGRWRAASTAVLGRKVADLRVFCQSFKASELEVKHDFGTQFPRFKKCDISARYIEPMHR